MATAWYILTVRKLDYADEVSSACNVNKNTSKMASEIKNEREIRYLFCLINISIVFLDSRI